MGIMSDLASTLKDVNFDSKINSDALQKQAECERDARNYEQKQETIRAFIGWTVFLIFWVSFVFILCIFRR